MNTSGESTHSYGLPATVAVSFVTGVPVKSYTDPTVISQQYLNGIKTLLEGCGELKSWQCNHQFMSLSNTTPPFEPWMCLIFFPIK